MSNFLQSLIKTNGIIATDFRNGAIFDLITGITTKAGVLNHNNIKLTGSNRINFTNSLIDATELTFFIKLNYTGKLTNNSPISRYTTNNGCGFYTSSKSLKFTIGYSTGAVDKTVDTSFNPKTDHNFALSFKNGQDINYYKNGLLNNTVSNTFSISWTGTTNFATGFFNGIGFNGSIDYIYVFDKSLTAAEVAEITSELNAGIPEQKADSQIYESTKSALFDGSRRAVGDNIGYTQLSGGFKFKAKFRTGSDVTTFQRLQYQDQVLNGSGSYANSISIGSGSIYFYLFAGIGDNINRVISANTEYDLIVSYDETTLSMNLNGSITTKSHAGGGAAFSSVAQFMLGSRFDGSDVFGGILREFKIYDINDNLLADYDFKTGDSVNIYDMSNNGNDLLWNPSGAYIPYEKEIFPFKAELHALANESSISSGFLENTGWSIQAGAAKVITAEKDNVLCKILENTTSGTIYKPIKFNGQKWSFWFKKGASGNDLRIGFMADGIATNPFDSSIKCFYVHINDTTNIGITQNNNGTLNPIVTGGPITDTEFHLLEITKIENEITVYIDGVLNCTGAATINFDSKYQLYDWDSGDQIIFSSKSGIYDFYQKAEI
jgi:hypothetical protein